MYRLINTTRQIASTRHLTPTLRFTSTHSSPVFVRTHKPSPVASTSRSPNVDNLTYIATSAAALLAFGATVKLVNNQTHAFADSAVGMAKADLHPNQPTTSTDTLPKPETQDLINWSGTHAVSTDRFYQPESIEELKEIVRHAHATKQKLRPVGSALSPNGLPFNHQGMVSLSNMDNILSVDPKTMQVTIQAGARVSQVVEALRPHGLTLQNFASITEQQIGGFTQVGAHGTGVSIPPVDEQVVSIRLITPAVGELVLSQNDEDNSLFHVARTSLGLLGVVAEITLQCVPAHKLRETTFVLSRNEVLEQHNQLMTQYKHLRYMWIPNTNDVIVVGSNPLKPTDTEDDSSPVSRKQRLEPVKQLLLSNSKNKLSKEQVDGLRFTELRNELLSLDPLNVAWMKKVNQAEANYWRQSQGVRIDWSDKILQFDCGGQQWVSEVVFPVHSSTEKHQDIDFVDDLMKMIDEENIPAPGPIEQRWTSPSVSPMSPASERPGKRLGDFYSWVGIIMYMPDEEVDRKKRQQITEAFKAYKMLWEKKQWKKYQAVEHWAKIELPHSEEEKAMLQQRTAEKYPVEAFKALSAIFDPHGILRNELVECIFGPFPTV